MDWFTQALAQLDAWRGGIVPELEQALLRSESALSAGDVSYLDFLQSKLLVLDARRQQAEAVANLRRAKARLETGVGHRLDLRGSASEVHGQVRREVMSR